MCTQSAQGGTWFDCPTHAGPPSRFTYHALGLCYFDGLVVNQIAATLRVKDQMLLDAIVESQK